MERSEKTLVYLNQSFALALAVKSFPFKEVILPFDIHRMQFLLISLKSKYELLAY